MSSLTNIPQWPDDLTSEIRCELLSSNRTLVVFDDDPTGTQTVYDVSVLTVFDESSLVSAVGEAPPVLYLLTNSRSLTEQETRGLHVELARTLQRVAASTGRQLELVSRSDSTLRGHFPLETDALSSEFPEQADLTLVMPFFAEGGRITINGQHFVCDGDELTPAHETPFAEDPVFGFQNSFLPAWISEKTSGRIRPDDVIVVNLETIRRLGPDGVRKQIDDAPAGSYIAVDSVTDQDAAVVAAAIGKSERRILARVAASYVRARAGLVKQPLLTGEQLCAEDQGDTGGLIVVGSHVPKTTAQLNYLLKQPGLKDIELSIRDVIESPGSVVSDVIRQVNESLANGIDTVMYTSRELVTADSDEENLKLSSLVSAAVSDIVASLDVRPRYLIAKGGITSSDIATKSLGVKLATVAGSILPGIPVWRIGHETKFPGMHYVIFPGNVGGDDALALAVEKLSRKIG